MRLEAKTKTKELLPLHVYLEAKTKTKELLPLNVYSFTLRLLSVDPNRIGVALYQSCFSQEAPVRIHNIFS